MLAYSSWSTKSHNHFDGRSGVQCYCVPGIEAIMPYTSLVYIMGTASDYYDASDVHNIVITIECPGAGVKVSENPLLSTDPLAIYCVDVCYRKFRRGRLCHE